MPRLKQKKTYGWLILILVVLVSVVALWIHQRRTRNLPILSAAPEPAVEAVIPIEKPRTVLDFGQLGQPSATEATTVQRKAELGVGQGIDMIVKSDESFKVGETTVPMGEILDQIRLKQGDILEKTIDPEGDQSMDAPVSGVYGIYVVQPGDNIWNVHFKFLQDYFKRKGVSLTPLADEPDPHGFSSGVGKVLKFSENMVHIYNLKEKTLDVNINLIRPLNKIIIYNMDQIFALLDRIDTTLVHRLQFDGETLWIPADE